MISVCIATYNGESYIREQLTSILSQLSDGDEIIVSDDGSTDHTLDIISNMHSPLVHVVINEGEHGYTPNFENALCHAHGDIIFLSDQDDVWTSEKVSIVTEHLRHVDMIFTDADIIDDTGRTIAKSYFQERHTRHGLWNNLLRFSYLGCCMAFRREVLVRSLPFPTNHKYCTHDNWLGLVGLTFYRTAVIDKCLFHYRRHQTNASKGGLQPTTTFLFKLAYRLYLLYWLLRRS